MSVAQSFWSRRKAGVAAEAEAEEAALDAQALSEEHRALEELSDTEILMKLNLPDPESLKQGDDFTAFMAKIVPDRIRRRALRTLWRSNPTLANVDMLVDYGEDFTDKATVVENLQTAYQVGKGMLKHIEEMARKAETEAAPSAPEAIDDLPEEETVLAAAPAEDAGMQAERFEPAPEAEDMNEEEPAIVPPTPRRMKFRTEETA